MSKSNEYICFGPHQIHRRFATEHFLATGTTGSGKTTVKEGLEKSLFKSQLPFRAVNLDSKTDALPVLYRLAGDTRICIEKGTSRVKPLNCFDLRGFAWSMGADIDTPVLAYRNSAILVRQGGGHSESESYFKNALLDMVTGAQVALMNAPNPRAWTLRDLLLSLFFEPYTRALFSKAKMSGGHENPMFSRLLSSYVDCDPRLASSVRSTISANLGVYEPIAACWDAARRLGRSVSLRDWATDASTDILVLGSDESARNSLEVLNQALFQRTVDLTLARRESTKEERDTGTNQTWFILDEIREAGTLDGLSSLMVKGRSKNVACFLAFQDINGLKEVYGEQRAIELVGQCNNAAFLRLCSKETAEWGASSFGERLTRGKGSSFGQDQDSRSIQHQSHDEVRPYLYSSDLLYLPLPNSSIGLSGYYKLAGQEPRSKEDLFGHISAADVERMRPARPDLSQEPWMAPFLPRPVSDQYLKPWDREDWERLGFSGDPPSWRYGEERPGPSVSDMMQSYIDGSDRGL